MLRQMLGIIGAHEAGIGFLLAKGAGEHPLVKKFSALALLISSWAEAALGTRAASDRASRIRADIMGLSRETGDYPISRFRSLRRSKAQQAPTVSFRHIPACRLLCINPLPFAGLLPLSRSDPAAAPPQLQR